MSMIFLNVCTSAFACACIPVRMCASQEDDLWESVLSSCYVGPGKCTQVIRLSGKHLYLPNHLSALQLATSQIN